jgi:hypothetical protein
MEDKMQFEVMDLVVVVVGRDVKEGTATKCGMAGPGNIEFLVAIWLTLTLSVDCDGVHA